MARCPFTDWFPTYLAQVPRFSGSCPVILPSVCDPSYVIIQDGVRKIQDEHCDFNSVYNTAVNAYKARLNGVISIITQYVDHVYQDFTKCVDEGVADPNSAEEYFSEAVSRYQAFTDSDHMNQFVSLAMAEAQKEMTCYLNQLGGRIDHGDVAGKSNAFSAAISAAASSFSSSLSAVFTSYGTKVSDYISTTGQGAVYKTRLAAHKAALANILSVFQSSVSNVLSTMDSSISPVLSQLDSKIAQAISDLPGTTSDGEYQAAVNWYTSQMGGTNVTGTIPAAFSKSISDATSVANASISALKIYSKPGSLTEDPTKEFTDPVNSTVASITSIVDDLSTQASSKFTAANTQATSILRKMYDAAFAKFKEEVDPAAQVVLALGDLITSLQAPIEAAVPSSQALLADALTKFNNYMDNNQVSSPFYVPVVVDKLRSIKAGATDLVNSAVNSVSATGSSALADASSQFNSAYTSAISGFNTAIGHHTIYGSQDDDFYKHYIDITNQVNTFLTSGPATFSAELSKVSDQVQKMASDFRDSAFSRVDDFYNNRPLIRLTGKVTIPPLDYEGSNVFKFEFENIGKKEWVGRLGLKFFKWDSDPTHIDRMDDQGHPIAGTYDTYLPYNWDKDPTIYKLGPGEKQICKVTVPFDRLFPGLKASNLKFNIFPIPVNVGG